MALINPTLVDLMAILPSLHPLQLLRSKVSTIRGLRQVSKEVGRMAMAAVTCCEVHLGEGGPCPSPEQLVRLMTGAQLAELKVTVHVVSGKRQWCFGQRFNRLYFN